MPYYDETTGLWYDEDGNVVPAPTETGPQPGAGTYGASGAPTTIDPGTGDITWNIPAPGRTERLQGNIGDLGYQLAISGASLERAEQQLGERFDAGEYFRQINLYRNTIWAMEHGDRYLGGRQLPGALADVPAFTEELQRQPATAQGLQGALQDQPTPTDQQQQITPDQQAATVPFNPQAEANRLEYNRRLAANPDLQSQGYQPIPENYDIEQGGFMQPAPELGAQEEAAVERWEGYPFAPWQEFEIPPAGAAVEGLPTAAEVDAEMARVLSPNSQWASQLSVYWPRSNNQIDAARRIALQNLGVTEEQLAAGGVSDEEWALDPEEAQELMERFAAGDPFLAFDFIPGMPSRYGEELWAYGQMTEEDFNRFIEAAGGEAAELDMDEFEDLMGALQTVEQLGLDADETGAYLGALGLDDTAAALQGMDEDVLTALAMGVVAGEEEGGVDWRGWGAMQQEQGISKDDMLEEAMFLGASGEQQRDAGLGFDVGAGAAAQMGTPSGRIRDFVTLSNDAGIIYNYGSEGQEVNGQLAYDCSSWVSQYFNQNYGLNLRFTTRSVLADGHGGLFEQIAPGEALQPEDLVILPRAGEAPNHMGIFMGGGQVANLSSTQNQAAIVALDNFVSGEAPQYYRYKEADETVEAPEFPEWPDLPVETRRDYWRDAGGEYIAATEGVPHETFEGRWEVEPTPEQWLRSGDLTHAQMQGRAYNLWLQDQQGLGPELAINMAEVDQGNVNVAIAVLNDTGAIQSQDDGIASLNMLLNNGGINQSEYNYLLSVLGYR